MKCNRPCQQGVTTKVSQLGMLNIPSQNSKTPEQPGTESDIIDITAQATVIVITYFRLLKLA